MIKLVLTGPEFHIAQGQKQQVGHKQQVQVAKPFSPLQALPSVRSKSHQNWVDYPSLSLRKAWKLRTLTQYVLFLRAGEEFKMWDLGSTSPLKRSEKFSIRPGFAAPTTRVLF